MIDAGVSAQRQISLILTPLGAPAASRFTATVNPALTQISNSAGPLSWLNEVRPHA
jgi:hypothetical protein